MSSDQEKETKAVMNFLHGRKFYTILRHTWAFLRISVTSLASQSFRVAGIKKEGVKTELQSNFPW